jgi:hypothetical protein
MSQLELEPNLTILPSLMTVLSSHRMFIDRLFSWKSLEVRNHNNQPWPGVFTLPEATPM